VGLGQGEVAAGGGAAKPVFSDLKWNQIMDKSFPPLFTDISQGKNLPKVLVDFTAIVGGNILTYFEMEFDNVLLTSLAMSGDSSSRATVAGSFAYDFIKMTYHPIKANGTLGAAITAQYDLGTALGSAADLANLYALGLSGPSSQEVPIPPSLWLLGSGLVGLAGWRRRLRR